MGNAPEGWPHSDTETMMEKRYIDTVRLLLEVAPVVFEEPGFAIKGGTAINLFLRDMPRLSVDIDLVYTDFLKPRDEALVAIASALGSIRERLAARGLEIQAPTGGVGDESKLFIRRGADLVKVEVNHVFRGTVSDVVTAPLVASAQDQFETEIELPVLSAPELYGSKLVATMDRQHPRDLFDVLGMYREHGLTEPIVECFVCYLTGHNRPVHEVLFGNKHDIISAFENEFRGMAFEEPELAVLLETRDRLWNELPAALTDAQKQFLLGLVEAAPDWGLMSCPHLAELPAIRWKLRNLEALRASNPAKFATQRELLAERL